jgi:hypothetical protein
MRTQNRRDRLSTGDQIVRLHAFLEFVCPGKIFVVVAFQDFVVASDGLA